MAFTLKQKTPAIGVAKGGTDSQYAQQAGMDKRHADAHAANKAKRDVNHAAGKKPFKPGY